MKQIFWRPIWQWRSRSSLQVLKQCKTIRWSIHSLSLKVKFPLFKCCCIHKESHNIISKRLNLKKNTTKILEVLRPIWPWRSRSRSPVFQLVWELYVINTWFKFEDKIQNTSKVIVFTRNHTDNEDVVTEPKKMSPLSRGGGHNELQWCFLALFIE